MQRNMILPDHSDNRINPHRIYAQADEMAVLAG
jgi:hypothetical protein